MTNTLVDVIRVPKVRLQVNSYRSVTCFRSFLGGLFSTHSKAKAIIKGTISGKLVTNV